MNYSRNIYHAPAARRPSANGQARKQGVNAGRTVGRRGSTGSKLSYVDKGFCSQAPVTNKYLQDLHHVSTKKQFYDPRASPMTISTASMSSHSSTEDYSIISLPSSCDNSPFMRDSNLINTAVFRRRFHGPAIRIQAAMRGMIQRVKYSELRLSIALYHIDKIESKAATTIQARFRGNQERDYIVPHLAALAIQSFMRNRLARMKNQASYLAVKLYRIRNSHMRELCMIDRNKQLELKRIKAELTEEAQAKERAQDEQVTKLNKEIDRLRKDNKKLRSQAKIMQKASHMMAEKNQKMIQRTEMTNHESLVELREAVARFESDNAQLNLVLAECQKRVDEYKSAQSQLEERIAVEQKISQRYAETLKHMHDACTDKKLAAGIIRKTSYV